MIDMYTLPEPQSCAEHHGIEYPAYTASQMQAAFDAGRASRDAEVEDWKRGSDAEASEVDRLTKEVEALRADAERLDWIELALFGHSWNGVMGSGSKTNWRVWDGYRHVAAKMIGNTFREAIDAARAAQEK